MNKELSLSASVQIKFKNQFRAQSDLVIHLVPCWIPNITQHFPIDSRGLCFIFNKTDSETQQQGMDFWFTPLGEGKYRPCESAAIQGLGSLSSNTPRKKTVCTGSPGPWPPGLDFMDLYNAEEKKSIHLARWDHWWFFKLLSQFLAHS